MFVREELGARKNDERFEYIEVPFYSGKIGKGKFTDDREDISLYYSCNRHII